MVNIFLGFKFGQRVKQVGQTIEGRDAVGFGGFHQAVQYGTGIGVGVTEQPIFAAHGEGTNGPLGTVVINA